MHHIIFIGLLSVLFIFKRSRYASFIYLVAYFSYLIPYSNGLIADNYYHVFSSSINTFIFVFLFKNYEYEGVNKMLDLNKYTVNQLTGLLSLLLIIVNLIGWIRLSKGYGPTIYNNDYRSIVLAQISILYIGNMINAWVDRRDHKRAMVRLTDIDYFETLGEIHKKEKV